VREIELLQPHHDRMSFDCGDESLNLFLQKYARQNADRHVGVTHVVVEKAGESRILGLYTLVNRTVDHQIVPSKQLPRGPIGVVLLGRLAVAKDAQGRGLGKAMLIRALAQTVRASEDIGIYALVVDALNESARAWYLGLDWGFIALLDDPRHLHLPIATIRQLGLR
jgi:GNAT superfamily N-acetyltransferase